MNKQLIGLCIVGSILIASASQAAGISAAADVKLQAATSATSAAADVNSAAADTKSQAAGAAERQVVTMPMTVPFNETNMQKRVGDTTGLLPELERIVGDYLDEYEHKATLQG